MKPEAQRIAIAEACGWKQHTGPALSGRIVTYWICPKTKDAFDDERWMPDYLEDLNAMHAAEITLTMNQPSIYVKELAEVLQLGDAATDWWDRWYLDKLISASASQRAEAFLRTLNLWTE